MWRTFWYRRWETLQRYLPWRLQHQLRLRQNRAAFARLTQPQPTTSTAPIIVFDCGFHGISGGPTAIAAIANLLSTHYRVFFISYPDSHFNPLLQAPVQLLARADCADVALLPRVLSARLSATDDVQVSLFISDENQELDRLHAMRALAPLLLSVHCFNGLATGRSPAELAQRLALAHYVHFVSCVQQQSFMPTTGAETPYQARVIGNLCAAMGPALMDPHGDVQPSVDLASQSSAALSLDGGGRVGCVGRLTDPAKGALETIAIARAAGMPSIQLWGGLGLAVTGADVQLHGWQSNKQRIYQSFDVLVFMSRFETFGLVVIEAMSAGKPCLLADIPAFRQFAACPGVILVDPTDTPRGAQALQHLMTHRQHYKPQLQAFWRQHFAPDVILQQWQQWLVNILASELRR
jgi:hypothetical protein